MPRVGNKRFPYTAAGRKAAAKARKPLSKFGPPKGKRGGKPSKGKSITLPKRRR